MQMLLDHPGLLFVAATLLPMASFVLLLLGAAVRWACRPNRETSPFARSMFQLLGGEVSGRGPAFVALAAIALAFVCSLTGCVWFLNDHHQVEAAIEKHEKEIKALEAKHRGPKGKIPIGIRRDINKLHEEIERDEHAFEHRWSASVTWAAIGSPRAKEDTHASHDHDDHDKGKDSGPLHLPDSRHGTVLEVGFRIDHLSALMFVMVTLIATLIHLFSIGYMADELQPVVEDHEVHTTHGHLHRRGRFGRFFMYLSLFCFSMLNLVLADNLFQVFVSWELVGICSYLLIGHYFERTSASNASNKAFITNRIGDAGFVLGLMIIWTYIGSFNFTDIQTKLRTPAEAHVHGSAEKLPNAGKIIRGDLIEGEKGAKNLRFNASGSQALLFPYELHVHAHELAPKDAEGQAQIFMDHGHPREIAHLPAPGQFSAIPYWLLVAAGLGIFLGCVGKSAQFPLQVWLPDAMEGPTPVSALIHAATMVAAGVYLVGRVYFLFTPEVLLTIAYTGAITLFVAATIAIVMTDIKKVLAYSTVSQLGYMMLALGVGGWAAGLFHLLTHAFFKALLFLGSGSVIYGCHHQQDMLKMGGLYPKMKITALTMLMGVLAIAGIPLFSGWYSKDAVLAHAMGFGLAQPQHMLLFILPLVTAGITTFYMFRMWFLTFTGEPRDHHVYEHAKESPWPMTVPLIVLAFFSVTVAWGWPLYDAHASALEHQLHHSQPASVEAEFGAIPKEGSGVQPDTPTALAHDNHDLAGLLALGMVVLGLSFAAVTYYYRILNPDDAREQFPAVHRFLQNKWYFDELYSAILVRPALRVAAWCRAFDTRVIDGFVDNLGRAGVTTSRESGRFDKGIIDGLANLIANVSYAIGAWFRNVQTGYIRSYVLFLVLAAVGIWIVMNFILGAAAAP